MTSHITSDAILAGGVGEHDETGLSTQSELLPSACWVELPSKPHKGSCSRVGKPVVLLDLRFSAQVRGRRITVQPKIFELILGHSAVSRLMMRIPRDALGCRQTGLEGRKQVLCQIGLREEHRLSNLHGNVWALPTALFALGLVRRHDLAHAPHPKPEGDMSTVEQIFLRTPAGNGAAGPLSGARRRPSARRRRSRERR